MVIQLCEGWTLDAIDAQQHERRFMAQGWRRDAMYVLGTMRWSVGTAPRSWVALRK